MFCFSWKEKDSEPRSAETTVNSLTELEVATGSRESENKQRHWCKHGKLDLTRQYVFSRYAKLAQSMCFRVDLILQSPNNYLHLQLIQLLFFSTSSPWLLFFLQDQGEVALMGEGRSTHGWAHSRVLCEHLYLTGTLFKGTGSALKVSKHLPWLSEHLPCFVCTGAWPQNPWVWL